jgi:enamine deaminase RidA (YjgF/YER057c/UK114 family)
MKATRRDFCASGIGAVISTMFWSAPVTARDPFGRDAQFLRILGRGASPPAPIGLYLPARRSGNLLFLSTTVARANGEPRFRGQVGRDLTVEEGQVAARETALAMLEVVFAELGGSLDRVALMVNMIGYVASAEGFFDQAKVLDGASAVLIDVLGNTAGKTSRSAIGVKGLSGNAAVAISAVLEVAS